MLRALGLFFVWPFRCLAAPLPLLSSGERLVATLLKVYGWISLLMLAAPLYLAVSIMLALLAIGSALAVVASILGGEFGGIHYTAGLFLMAAVVIPALVLVMALPGFLGLGVLNAAYFAWVRQDRLARLYVILACLLGMWLAVGFFFFPPWKADPMQPGGTRSWPMLLVAGAAFVPMMAAMFVRRTAKEGEVPGWLCVGCRHDRSCPHCGFAERARPTRPQPARAQAAPPTTAFDLARTRADPPGPVVPPQPAAGFAWPCPRCRREYRVRRVPPRQPTCPSCRAS